MIMNTRYLHQNIIILSLVLLAPVCDRESEPACSAEELEKMTLSSLEKVETGLKLYWTVSMERKLCSTSTGFC
jgi:hypothetical protein